MKSRVLVAVALAGGLGAACGGLFGGLFRSPSPSERYAASLEKAGLLTSALGQDWIRAGEGALASPMVVNLPVRETGYFPAEPASAVGYRLELVRGRILLIEIAFASERPAQLFVDLFRLRPGEEPDRVAWLPPDSTVLRYEVRRDGDYLLRLQPELLRSGRYTVVQRTVASLRFPVPGLGAGAILSGFGALRDAGRREHEGVDIFAERGTPAIAVASGTAFAGLNQLGGNVVWLEDAGRRRTFYYAHLDRWAREGSSKVLPGDTVGFIGNTGNALTTRPHLHFGIYENGPVDPLPFLSPDDPVPPPSEVPLDRLDHWVRVTSTRTVLRAGPGGRADTVARLPAGAVGLAMAGARETVRLRLPDGSAGYVEEDALVAAREPVRRERLPAGTPVQESPSPSSPAIEILAQELTADVLGSHADYDLVRLRGERLGWVKRRGEGRGERSEVRGER
ncbi:MAG: peptidoglycan DD-metalloendopeptidase family protein [Gemmatimonadales bacterium]